MKDLRATQVGAAITLSFTLPRLATDGRSLTKPLEVVIFRRVAIAGAAKAPPLITTTPWVVIQPSNLAAFERGSEFHYPAGPPPAQLRPFLQTVFTFRVVTLTRGFRGRAHKSGPSNPASVELLNVSAPLNGVKLRQVPGAIELSWQAPDEPVAPGAPLAALQGYRVYRSMGSAPATLRLLGEVASPDYKDDQIQFGRKYIYVVRAVFGQNGQSAMSADSVRIATTPRRIFPPPAPTGLAAVFTGTKVDLVWTPETAPDLAGYNVYRQAQGGSPKRLNRELLRTPAFADRAVSPGKRYTYWATAVDAAQNESQPSAAAAVEVR